MFRNVFRGLQSRLTRTPKPAPAPRRVPAKDAPAPAASGRIKTAPPRQIPLSGEQIDEIMAAQWTMRVATVGPGSRINLTPMWFGWAGGAVYFFGQGQKIVNLRRNPVCTVIVDRNEKFPELQGIMLQGQGRVLEDTEAEANDPHLANVRKQIGLKYNGGYGQPLVDSPPPFAATARGRNRRWVVMAPEYVVSWDHFKLSNSSSKNG